MTDQTKKATFSSPPKLSGYYYSPEDARRARDTGQLLSIRLETSLKCNLRCNYCCNKSGEALPDELSYAQLLDLVRQAKALDAQSIVVIGGGEPTVYPQFRELLETIASLEMIPVIFTNALTMTEDLAQFLWEVNASVITKMDSLDEDLQDELVGVKGAFRRMRVGRENLMKVGFADVEDENNLRLGTSFVISKRNIDELPDLWRYCRENRVFPNLEMLIPDGRAQDMDQILLSLDEWNEAKAQLLKIDQEEHGYDWLVYTPLSACGCFQVMYSAYVTVKGDVRPCASINTNDVGLALNVKEMSLAEIIKVPFFQTARQIDHKLTGRCGQCEYLEECVGCRGLAFMVGINSGMTPLEALCSEDPSCFKLVFPAESPPALHVLK